VAAALQQHRMLGGGLVQFGGGGQSALGELQLMPVGGGDDPQARRGLRGPFPDQRDDLGDVAGPGDRDAEDIAGGQHQVVVRVNEGRQHDQARIVEHHRVRAPPAGQQASLAVGPGGGRDRAVADGQGGDRAGVRIHGPHRGRSYHQVGGRSGAHRSIQRP
jgi:hypothetical protein